MIRFFLLLWLGINIGRSEETLRIASYSPGATQILIDLNCADQIVAATPWCPLPTKHRAARDCDSFNPDLEKLLLKKTTLVILPRLANPLWANRCTQAGLKVLVLSPESKTSVSDDIRLIGAAVRQEKLAQDWIITLEKSRSVKNRKILIIWDGMMAGQNSYLAGPLEKIGFVLALPNVTWIKCDWEIIAQADPDIVLWINNESADGLIDFSDSRLNELKSVPVVQNIKAVKNAQVFTTNSGSNWLPGSGLIKACLKLDNLPISKNQSLN